MMRTSFAIRQTGDPVRQAGSPVQVDKQLVARTLKQNACTLMTATDSSSATVAVTFLPGRFVGADQRAGQPAPNAVAAGRRGGAHFLLGPKPSHARAPISAGPARFPA
jgi:hypothetical protein